MLEQRAEATHGAATETAHAAPSETADSPAADYRLGLTTQGTELEPTELPVEGTIPPWLEGALIRNGPARFEGGDTQVRHWFDGSAMLHKFALAHGEVRYSNRFLRTRSHAALADGRIGYSEFATDPCRSIFKRFAAMFSPQLTDNASVNLVRLGDDFVAMTETPLPVRFDPATLDTLGVVKYEDSLRAGITTAHPHLDPRSGDLVNYVAELGARSRYTIYRQAPGETGRRRRVASLPVKEPAYMHSFGITDRYVVLVEFPLVVNPLRLAGAGRPFIENYRWRPERGARFHVVDSDDGSVRAAVQAEPFFAFHHVNAFEDGDALVVDLAGYADPAVIDALYRRSMLDPDSHLPPVRLRRYRVPLDGSDATFETIGDEKIELPRIDYRRRNGRRHRYAYGISSSGDRMRSFSDQLVKVDADDGATAIWREEGCHPGEPVFVAAPGGSAEDEGVALSVVLDTRSGRSFLLVLDAGSFEELARAEVPQYAPFTFHGQFLSGVE
jgi:carotenoid cleavage dioxygenase-like enzyme